jgi:rhamnose utilization protein RhaD (predicted bifunctional aldolase and dehydrogenase)
MNRAKGIEGLAQIFGCRVAFLPMKCSGLALGASCKDKVTCVMVLLNKNG